MIPRIPTEHDTAARSIAGDPRPELGVHMISCRGNDFVINDANHINIGRLLGASGERITLLLLRSPDALPHGMGLCIQLTVDEAISVGQALTDLANAHAAVAAEQAAAAIARAKGGAA